MRMLATMLGGILVLGACVSPPVTPSADTSPPAPSPSPNLPSGPGDVSAEAPRYHAVRFVQSIPGRHPPLLCIGSDELCGLEVEGVVDDIPITNWDWDAVEGEEEIGGRIGAWYYLIGRYDGEAFTVTSVAAPEESPWHRDEPRDYTPDHCLGVGWRTKTRGVTLTGPDRVCIAPHEYRRRELNDIRGRVQDLIERRGLDIVWSDQNAYLKHIQIGVLTPDPAVERLVERRWGRGVVEFYPALYPYDARGAGLS